MKDKEYSESFLLHQYIKHFNIHFNLLLKRYKRFKEINTFGNTDIDVITYLDMIVVQLRAMCIENHKNNKNYTAQILLNKLGKKELAQKIDNMLNEPFDIGFEELNIREALKILADKFICHYDNFDGKNIHRLSLADIIMHRLINPYEKNNLDYIMKTLIECIGKGILV